MDSINTKSKFKSLIFSYMFCFMVPTLAMAIQVETPEYIDDVTLVGAEGLIELIERIDNLVIVDSRISGDREKGYIESSVSLPDIETNCKSLSKILPKKSSSALFYCNGVKCGRSAVAINIAKTCGYKELYWFRGGYEMWLKKGFPYVLD